MGKYKYGHQPVSDTPREEVFNKGAKCVTCGRDIVVVQWGGGFYGSNEPIVPVVMRHKGGK